MQKLYHFIQSMMVFDICVLREFVRAPIFLMWEGTKKGRLGEQEIKETIQRKYKR